MDLRSAVCSIEESYGPQNLQVPIVLRASKSAGAQGNVPKIYGLIRCKNMLAKVIKAIWPRCDLGSKYILQLQKL